MRRLLAVVVPLLVFVACGKSSTSNNPTVDASPPLNGVDGGTPPLVGDKYTLVWGPVTVPPSTEDTQCIVLKLSNTTDIKVHQLHNVLSTGSHHMIVYKDDKDTVEQPVPTHCQPFTGALNATGMVAPMMITQRVDDPLTLPDGVAYTLKAGQMIRIEMHYVNSGDAPIDVKGTTDFYAADPATIHDEANILFIGTPDIHLPPNSMMTVNQFFTPSRAMLNLDNAKFFAITGHTHKLGVDMNVNLAATKGGTKTPIYAPQPFQWSEPITAVFQPNEFQIPPGGGFDFKCTYDNTTSATVAFGEKTTDEMCFFWAYYYPSQGAHVCVHSDDHGGVDICCPESSLCSLLVPSTP